MLARIVKSLVLYVVGYVIGWVGFQALAGRLNVKSVLRAWSYNSFPGSPFSYYVLVNAPLFQVSVWHGNFKVHVSAEVFGRRFSSSYPVGLVI